MITVIDWIVSIPSEQQINSIHIKTIDHYHIQIPEACNKVIKFDPKKKP